MIEPKSRAGDLVAFWRYDKFPYVLGGHVTSMRKDGSVETREFGRGSYFAPIRLLPRAAGEEVLERLKAIRAEHDLATRAFNEDWSAKLDDQFPWMGEVR